MPSFSENPVITTSLTATILFAISPPPLPLFPPQGLPQPGVLSGGGGALPSVVTGVRKFICNRISLRLKMGFTGTVDNPKISANVDLY